VCQICGDSISVSATSDVFVACNECAFPVCRPCYEYEREGNQCCPQCKTRYKRQKCWFPGNFFEWDYKDKDGVKGLHFTPTKEGTPSTSTAQRMVGEVSSWEACGKNQTVCPDIYAFENIIASCYWAYKGVEEDSTLE
ncbi:hypothetical protein ACJX0J_028179, partial [Zea mays]